MEQVRKLLGDTKWTGAMQTTVIGLLVSLDLAEADQATKIVAMAVGLLLTLFGSAKDNQAAAGAATTKPSWRDPR